MKYSEKKVDEIIERYADIKITTAFLPFADKTWELFRTTDDNQYSVYVHYPKPKTVNMAIVSEPEIIDYMLPETMKEIESSEKFMFLFMAAIEEMKKSFGNLSKRQREYIAIKAHEEFLQHSTD